MEEEIQIDLSMEFQRALVRFEPLAKTDYTTKFKVNVIYKQPLSIEDTFILSGGDVETKMLCKLRDLIDMKLGTYIPK